MWNMSRRGFEELYEKLLGPKPDLEEVWRLTGGNPKMLAKLYQAKWDIDAVVRGLVASKKLDAFVLFLSADEKERLLEAVKDPDVLFTREGPSLLNRLVELNMVVDSITYRDHFLWIDEPLLRRTWSSGLESTWLGRRLFTGMQSERPWSKPCPERLQHSRLVRRP
jgi:hypothetical protein